MTIKKDGNVGIGTTSPTNTLHVRSDSNSNVDHLYLQNRDTGANTGARIAFSNGGVDYSDNRYAYIGAIKDGATGNHLVFASNASGSGATEKARLDSSGRLGLGTSTPQAELAVVGNILAGPNINNGLVSAPNHLGTANTSNIQVCSQGDANPSISLNHARSNNLGSSCFVFNKAHGNLATPTIVGSSSVLGTLVFNGFDGTNYIRGAQIGAEMDGTPGTNDMPGRLVFATTADGASSPTERMRIDSSGRVGIGTTSPSVNLHILGSDSAPSPRLRIQADDTASATSGIELYGRAPSNSQKIAALETDSGDLLFKTNNSEKCRIDESGRLLVGASSYRSVGSPYTPDTLFYNEGAGLGHYEVFVGVHNRNDSNGPLISLGKTRSTSVGGNTIVQNNDQLGGITFSGADGTDLQNQAANIFAYVDGTPGTDDMPGRLVFSTTADGASSPTERMRIDSDGSVLISGTNVNPSTTVFGTRIGGSTTAGYFATSRNVAGTTAVANVYGNAGQFRIMGDGDAENTNNAYGAISDIKLKENIVDASSQWADLKTLQVRNYNFKNETGFSTHTQIGLVAQEVELVSPGLVSESPDLDEDGNDLGTVTKSVNYSVLYMKAVKALQEAMERIEVLEAKVNALEGN